MQRLDKSKRKSKKQDWDVDNKFKYPSNYFGKGKENDWKKSLFYRGMESS